MALGPTQPPIQWVPGALSLGVKQLGHEAEHSPPSSAEIKEWVELYLHSPNMPSWHGTQLKNILTYPSFMIISHHSRVYNRNDEILCCLVQNFCQKLLANKKPSPLLQQCIGELNEICCCIFLHSSVLGLCVVIWEWHKHHSFYSWNSFLNLVLCILQVKINSIKKNVMHVSCSYLSLGNHTFWYLGQNIN
jgi:hypothetical protein